MTESIKQVPSKRPETEKPLVDDGNLEEQKHEKMERIADRAAHKANKTHQQYDENHNTFSN